MTSDDNYKFRISGPVSLYIYKVSKYNKTIYLFGDVHNAWENMCEDSGISFNKPSFYIDTINKCDNKTDCNFISTLLKEISTHNDLKNVERLKKNLNPIYIDIMYEEPYYFKRERTDAIKRFKLLKTLKTYYKLGGPLSYIRNLYAVCTHVDKKCFKYTNFYAIDFRNKIELDNINNLLDNLTHIINPIAYGTQIIDIDTYNTLIRYTNPEYTKNSIYGILDNVKKILSLDDKIIMNINTQSNDQLIKLLIDIFKNILKNEASDIFNEIQTCDIEIQNVLLNEYLLDIFTNGMIVSGDKIIKPYDEFKNFINAILNIKKDKLVVLYESLNKKIVHIDISEKKPIKMTKYEILFSELSNLYENLTTISNFLLDFNLLFMDLFTLAKIFKEDKSKIVNNYIIYAGDAHILNYIRFLQLINAKEYYSKHKEFDSDLKSTIDDEILGYKNDGYNRCLSVAIDKDDLISMNIQF